MKNIKPIPNQAIDHTKHVPDNVLFKVLSSLPGDDLMRLARVNKRFNRLTNAPTLWNQGLPNNDSLPNKLKDKVYDEKLKEIIQTKDEKLILCTKAFGKLEIITFSHEELLNKLHNPKKIFMICNICLQPGESITHQVILDANKNGNRIAFTIEGAKDHLLSSKVDMAKFCGGHDNIKQVICQYAIPSEHSRKVSQKIYTRGNGCFLELEPDHGFFQQKDYQGYLQPVTINDHPTLELVPTELPVMNFKSCRVM